MPKPPATDEGWYVLHDLRRVDWDAWRDATGPERDRAIEEGRAFLQDAAALAAVPEAAAATSGDDDAATADDGEAATSGGGRAATSDDGSDATQTDGEGASAVFSVLGHGADLMVLHLRPTIGQLDALERQFAQTALAAFTERTDSYVSVTEASGYTGAEDYFDPDAEADPGTRSYIESRLYPALPDAEFVSFYPMDKRREPEQNWYDLPFEERAEHVASHGEIGREYAGRVSQIISGSVGLDDFEWGVTLFADDPTDVKDLLYEMRFDPSTSQFADFGSFYSGRRFPPADLEAFLDGEPVPTQPLGERESGSAGGSAGAAGEGADAADAGLDDELAAVGTEVPDAGHAVVVRSATDVDALREEVDGLRGNFEHYDTHRATSVHEADDGAAVVVSAWETASAADTASGFLADLEDATETQVGSVGDAVTGSSDAADPSDATEGGDDSTASASGPPKDAATERGDGGAVAATADGVRASLEEQGIYAGQPHGEDVYALVLYSAAGPETLADEVEDLSAGFDRYDTHRGTTVYELAEASAGDDAAGVAGGDAADGEVAEEQTETDDAAPAERAVVSLWDTADAADVAADYLADLPAIVRQAGEGDGFGTMGMFYTVQPEHRADFLETFAEVGDLLAEMDGHRETELYASTENENELFIASQWDAKEDAMAFFRSDAFAETVEWGREVLADRPRHVFLA